MPITDALPDMKRELKFYPAKNNAPKKLTREQIQYFNEKGYIFPLNVFSQKKKPKPIARTLTNLWAKHRQRAKTATQSTGGTAVAKVSTTCSSITASSTTSKTCSDPTSSRA